MSLMCFWRVCDIMTNFLKYVALIDVMTNFLMSWKFLTTWHTFYVLTHDMCFYIMTNVCRNDVFLSLFQEQNIMDMWFRYYNEIFDVMTCFDVGAYFFILGQTFYIMTYIWLYDTFFTSWHIFDFMTHFWRHDTLLASWQTLWRHGVFLMSWQTWWRHDELCDVITCFYDILFDIIMFLMLCQTFWSNDKAFEVMMKLLTSKCVPFFYFRQFSQKLVSNLFSILAWTFPRMVLIWLNRSKGHFSRSPIVTLIVHLFKICSVTFCLCWHEASPGWWQWTVKRRIWLNHSKGHCQGQKGPVWLIFTYFSILISSIEVLPKCITSCCFSEVILVLFLYFNGVDWF